MSIFLIIIALTAAEPCKSAFINKGEPAPCSGVLIDKSAADTAFDIIEFEFPRAKKKIALLEKDLELDKQLVDSLNQKIVILEQSAKDLLDFAKKSMLDYDKAQKMHTLIVGVTIAATVVGMVLVFIAVGYVTKGFVNVGSQN